MARAIGRRQATGYFVDGVASSKAIRRSSSYRVLLSNSLPMHLHNGIPNRVALRIHDLLCVFLDCNFRADDSISKTPILKASRVGSRFGESGTFQNEITVAK
jgi:hypothetical protein